jgi:hypothetical protein
MPIRAAARRSAAAILTSAIATAAFATAAFATPAFAAGGAANAAPAAAKAACKPHTRSVAGQTATQALRTVSANIPAACGFTVSGDFLGQPFGIDGLELWGTTTYDSAGHVHLVYVNQGVVVNAYRIGASEYLRLYESATPNAAPDINVKGMWNAFGVTSNAVINAAGSTRWVRLTAAQQKKVSVNGGFVGIGSPAALAAALVKGTGVPWKLAGSATVRGIRCTVLSDATDSNQLYPAEKLYLNTATGLPVTIRYSYQVAPQPTTTFGSWSRTAAVTAPARIVAG